MKVKMLYSTHLLGTDIRLEKGHEYDAVDATNQPDWEAKGLVFVIDPKTKDSVLCTLGDECVKVR